MKKTSFKIGDKVIGLSNNYSITNKNWIGYVRGIISESAIKVSENKCDKYCYTVNSKDFKLYQEKDVFKQGDVILVNDGFIPYLAVYIDRKNGEYSFISTKHNKKFSIPTKFIEKVDIKNYLRCGVDITVTYPDDKTTKIMISSNIGMGIGESRCCPEDDFSYGEGYSIAFFRAYDKYCTDVLKFVSECTDNSREIKAGDIVKVINTGGKYANYVSFFAMHNINGQIAARYAYNDKEMDTTLSYTVLSTHERDGRKMVLISETGFTDIAKVYLFDASTRYLKVIS